VAGLGVGKTRAMFNTGVDCAGRDQLGNGGGVVTPVNLSSENSSQDNSSCAGKLSREMHGETVEASVGTSERQL